jgi:NADP-dependent 3-hydroxy acid dehydrogenase YdfG
MHAISKATLNDSSNASYSTKDNPTMSTIKAAVIGAYGGIGQALCLELSQTSSTMFLIGRDSEKLQNLAQGYGSGSCVADAADWDQIDRALGQAHEVMQGLNAVVCLAGSVLLKPMHLTSRAEWDATMHANLSAAAGALHLDVAGAVNAARLCTANTEALQLGELVADQGVVGQR